MPQTTDILHLEDHAKRISPSLKQCIPSPLSDDFRKMGIHTWKARMVNEHGSAVVFEGLHRQLSALYNTHPSYISNTELEKVLSFATEERRHGILCAAVSHSLGGDAIANALAVEEFPMHEDCSLLAGCIRNVLSVCCLSETVAVALIAAEREEMPNGPIRSLLTEIWSDECGHANFGWNLVQRLWQYTTTQDKTDINEYLAIAFAHLEDHELRHLPLHNVLHFPQEASAIGLCNGNTARALFYATVEGIIIVGLNTIGLSATTAWNKRHIPV